MAETKILNALLFDTRSIQKYIYAGNLLRTNIGASYIVDRIFFDVLVEGTLKKIFPEEDFSSAKDSAWEIDKDNEKPWATMKNCCVAYIGGGNALLLFSPENDKSVEVVKDFTRRLLVERPGLKVGAAHGKLTLTDGKLNQDDINALYTELKKNQNNIFPAVNVPYTGLTLSCEIDSEAANFCDTQKKVKPSNEIRFYSQETAVKAKFSDDANKNLKNRFDKIFAVKNFSIHMKDFDFPLSVDELGQKEQENYFSIIHVDGNNMGLKFRGCSTLEDRRKLSREIRRKTEGAFAELLLKIISAKNSGLFDKCLDLKENFLPIRPLIIGGDDVTFICPANFAIIFTQTLMELMNAETPENSPEHLTQKTSRQMDCCAGVAILPTNYPFFRGYELAEQLCDAAKKSMRENSVKNTSWLDFAILHGEQAPTLEQIRKNEYSGARGNLHFGPYQVANSNAQNKNLRRKNIENLLSCTAQFSYGVMAHGKVKELRSVLQRGKDDAAKFLQQLEYQQQKLPKVPDWEDYLTNFLWSEEKIPQTPYVDAIELTDFYLPEVAEKWQNLM